MASVTDEKCQMLWGSFGAKGTGRLANVQGMVNIDTYQPILQNQLLPTMRKELS